MSETPAVQPPARPDAEIILAGIGRDGSSIVHGIEPIPDVARKLFVTASPTRAIALSPCVLRIRSSENWREALKAAVAGTRMLVTVSAVSGREEAFTPDVLALARAEGALAVAVLVEPLLATSPRQNDEAERQIKEVTKTADATIVVAADLPASVPQSISEAMDTWSRRLAGAVLGLIGTAASDDALHMAMSDIAAVLSSHCRATVGTGEGATVEEALQDALKKNLATASELETARSVLAHVVLGSNAPLDEARRVGPILQQLFPKADVCAGVSVRNNGRAVRATLLAGKLDISAARPGSRGHVLQTESPFFKAGDPAIYDGENLDIPAFARRDITLPGLPPRTVPAQKTLFDAPVPVGA